MELRTEIKITELQNERFGNCVELYDELGLSPTLLIPKDMWERAKEALAIAQTLQSYDIPLLDLNQLKNFTDEATPDFLNYLAELLIIKSYSNHDEISGRIAYHAHPVRKIGPGDPFWSNDKENLEKGIKLIVDRKKSLSSSKPKMVFAPHLYVPDESEYLDFYSSAFAPLQGHAYSRIVMIGTSHYCNQSLLMISSKSFESPLGTAFTSSEFYSDLLHDDLVTVYDNAHYREHSLTAHLPFLQTLFPECGEYIFALTGSIGYLRDTGKLENVLKKIRDQDTDDTLYVFSGDLTHIGRNFGDELGKDDISRINGTILPLIDQSLNLNKAEDFLSLVMENESLYKVCGLTPFYLGMKLFPEHINYIDNSYYIWSDHSMASAVAITSKVYV